MSQINDDETVVVRDLALETDTLSPRVLGNVGIVYANIDQSVVGIDEPLVLSVTLVEVVCISMRGRIRSLRSISAGLLSPRVKCPYRNEVEHVEEVVRVIVVRVTQGIAGYTEVNEPGGCEEGREMHEERVYCKVCATRRDTDA